MGQKLVLWGANYYSSGFRYLKQAMTMSLPSKATEAKALSTRFLAARIGQSALDPLMRTDGVVVFLVQQ